MLRKYKDSRVANVPRRSSVQRKPHPQLKEKEDDGFSRRLGSFDRMVEDPFSVQQDICESICHGAEAAFVRPGRCCGHPASWRRSEFLAGQVGAHFTEDVSAASMSLEAAGKAI